MGCTSSKRMSKLHQISVRNFVTNFSNILDFHSYDQINPLQIALPLASIFTTFLLNGTSQHSKLTEKIQNPTNLLEKVFENLFIEAPLNEVKKLMRSVRLWCLLSYGEKSSCIRKKLPTLQDFVDNEYLTECEMRKLGLLQQRFTMDYVL